MNYFVPGDAIGPWIGVIFLWATLWKGIALWRSAKLGQRNWFIAMLVLSTAGILEIIYLFKFSKNPLTFAEIKSWLPGSSEKSKSG